MDYEALGRYVHNKEEAKRLSEEIGECSRAINAACRDHTHEAVDTDSIRINNEKLMRLEKELKTALREANTSASVIGRATTERGEYEV